MRGIVDKSNLTSLARNMRKDKTKPELILWFWLRNKQVDGVKFRRQQPVGDYIVDFVSFERKIVIELDGGQHSEEKNVEKDRMRTRWLESQGFQVLRFWNSDVLENLDGVVGRIREVLNGQSPSP